jgi:hypothetical protein
VGISKKTSDLWFLNSIRPALNLPRDNTLQKMTC